MPRLLYAFALTQAVVLLVNLAIGAGMPLLAANALGAAAAFCSFRWVVWRSRSTNPLADQIVLFVSAYVAALGVAGLLEACGMPFTAGTTFLLLLAASGEMFVFSCRLPPLMRHPLFLLGLAIRIALLPAAGATSLTHGVLPLVSHFALWGVNPYDAFLGTEALKLAYPLSPLVLAILAVPAGLARMIGGDPTWALALVKLPLLAADIAILLILRKLVRSNDARSDRRLLLLYWLSPIVLYVTYVQGQLDILPIAVLLGALIAIWRGRDILGMLVLGLGIAMKANVVVALPFVAIHLWRSGKRWWRIAALTLLAAAPYAFAALLMRDSPGFAAMLAFARTEIARIALHSSITLGGLTVYLVPLLLVMLALRVTYYRIMTRDTLIMSLAVAFLLVIVLTPPLSGWFLWSLPFILYFFLRYDRISARHLHLMNAAFVGYFIIASTSSELFVSFAPLIPALGSLAPPVMLQSAIPAAIIANLAFTLLVGTLLINGVWVYTHGLIGRSERMRPVLIGIAGDSGAGKNRTSDLLSDALGRADVTMLEGDDLHRWERGDAHWAEITHLDPRANRLHEDLRTTKRLARRRVERTHYDHSTGRFTGPQEVRPARYVILNGLHALYLPELRDTLDVKVYLAPDPALRLHWKAVRDIGERGYTRERVIAQLRSRSRDARMHIAPQARHADVVISFRPERVISGARTWDLSLRPKLVLDLHVRAGIDLGPLLDALRAAGMDASVSTARDGRQSIRLRGQITAADCSRIAAELLPGVDAVADGAATFAGGLDGALQLALAWLVHEREREREEADG